MKLTKSKLKQLIKESIFDEWEKEEREEPEDMSRWTDEETWAPHGSWHGKSGRWHHLFRDGSVGAAFADEVLDDIENDPKAKVPSTGLDLKSLKGKLADAIHDWWDEQHKADSDT